MPILLFLDFDFSEALLETEWERSEIFIKTSAASISDYKPDLRDRTEKFEKPKRFYELFLR